MSSTAFSGALVDAAQGTLAQRDLLAFAALVHGKWQSPQHIRYLASLLERVERGEIQRLAISAPPGHGKSWLLQTFLAWFLGRDPCRRILAISASESLAKRNSRDAQSLATDDSFPFVDCKLANDSVLDWSTTRGGSVRAIGKGGVISGFRAELVIVDDLQADAGSDVTRASDYEWFQSVLSTRLEPDGAVVIIQTRWHDDDVIGQLAQSEAADQWTFVNLPAIATEADILGRSEGTALWPERWPVEKLQAKKAEVGSSVFAALYQGDPVPAGGATFPASSLEHRYDTLPTKRVDTPLADAPILFGARREEVAPLVVQAVDSAWKAGPSSDRTAIATVISDGVHFYVADVFADRIDYSNLKRILLQQYDKWHPSRIFVEEAASGYALISELRQTTPIPVIPVRTGGSSKEARAEGVVGLFEAGRVLWPRRATWLDDALEEFRRFPHGRHDDRVDSVVYAIAQAEQILRSQEGMQAITHLFRFGLMGR